MSAVDKFPVLLSEAEEESSAVPPCFSDEGINVCQLSCHCEQQHPNLTSSSTYTSAIITSTSSP
jgi:hypothetical protein